MVKLPAEPSPTAGIDTREQNPVEITGMPSKRVTLTTGDYTIIGLENVVALERKSAEDMLACVGRERERFDREVVRLLAYPVRGLIVESSWSFFERGEWRGDVKPAAALGSLLGWMAAGLPILMADDHERAGRYISRILFIAARRRWREARALIQATEIAAK